MDIIPSFTLPKNKTNLDSSRDSSFLPFQQFKHLAPFFTPGTFYYYIVNLKTNKMEYVHKGTKELLGISSNDFNLTFFLNCLSDNQKKKLAQKESVSKDFYENFLNSNEVLKYKVKYFIRIRNVNKQSKNILHQAIPLGITDNGEIEQLMIIHTDVSHLKLYSDTDVSFIHLNKGKSYFNVPSEGSFFSTSENKAIKLSKVLTKREIEICQLFSEGLNAKAIADQLTISFNTVRTHRKNILAKSKCKNTNSVIAKAVVEGIIK